MPIQGVILGFVTAVLLARASCHNIQYFRQLPPAVHTVPAHPAPPALIHTAFPQKHAILPAPLLPHRSFHQVLLPTVHRIPPPLQPTYVVHPVPTKILAAPPVVLPQPPVVTQHRSVIVSSVLNHPTPQRQVVVAGYPQNLPVIVPSGHPFVVVPDYFPRHAPVATVPAVPLPPKFVQVLPTPPNITHPPAPVKIQEVPALPDEVPPKLSYVVHQHTKLVQVAPPPPPPPPPPPVIPEPIVQRLVPAAEVVQPVTAVHVTPVQQERQVHVIREVVRPTYVIERLSKKQRKFRKIKMLKNCSLLRKLKHQFGTSVENYELFDEPLSSLRQDAHWDAHVHSPQSLGIEVYRPFHGHLPTFYKRKGR